MILSPFTPICFPDGKPGGLSSRYMQTWSPTDQIMLQVVADADESAPAATLDDAYTKETVSEITWESWEINENETIYYAILTGLAEGHYTVTIDGNVSEPFCVTEDSARLAKTTLIQYRFKDNMQRADVVSVINHVPYFFDMRVPGGFKDSGWTFGVSNEQFATQHEDIVELYARDFVIKQFTLGTSVGVPVWFGMMLNLILTCPYVYFDGKRYTRNDAETPQPNILVEGLDSFVYTQSLREIKFLDRDIEAVNQVALRRADANSYRSIDSTTNRLIK